jgi:hypothetical protein
MLSNVRFLSIEPAILRIKCVCQAFIEQDCCHDTEEALAEGKARYQEGGEKTFIGLPNLYSWHNIIWSVAKIRFKMST